MRNPTAAAIGSTDPNLPLSETSIDQHDRIRVTHLGWNPVLNVHLHPVAYGAAGQGHAFDSVEVVAPFRKIEDRAVATGGGAWRYLGVSLARRSESTGN